MMLCAMANTTSGTQPTSTTSSARRAIIGSPGLIRPSDLCNQWGGPPYKSSPLCSAVTLMLLRRLITRAVLLLFALSALHLGISHAVIEFGLKHFRLGLRQRRPRLGAVGLDHAASWPSALKLLVASIRESAASDSRPSK